MKKVFFTFALASLFCLASASTTQAVIVVSENFETGFVDQAPLVAADGNASDSFDANDEIGDTNTTGDAAFGGIYASPGVASALSTRNGTRGYMTAPATGFTLAGGSGVGQLHTHTGGGFGVLSVGPIATIGGVNNQPTPIVLSFSEGDIVRVSFDLFIQANGTDTSGGINWNIKDASFNVIPFSDSWNEFHTGAIGSQTNVSKDLTITADMISAGIDSVGPQFTFHNNSGNMAFNTAYAQIDNFQIEHISVPEPSSFAFLGLIAAGVYVRRKWSAAE